MENEYVACPSIKLMILYNGTKPFSLVSKPICWRFTHFSDLYDQRNKKKKKKKTKRTRVIEGLENFRLYSQFEVVIM